MTAATVCTQGLGLLNPYDCRFMKSLCTQPPITYDNCDYLCST